MVIRLRSHLAESLPAGHGHLHSGLPLSLLTVAVAAIAPAALVTAAVTLVPLPVTATLTAIAPAAQVAATVTLGPIPVTATIAAVAPAAQSQATADLRWPTIQATITASAPPPLVHGHATLWYRLRRDLQVSYTVSSRVLANQVAGWGEPARTLSARGIGWSPPLPAVSLDRAAWSHFARPLASGESHWGQFDALSQPATASWQRFLTAEVPRRLVWTAPGPALWHVGRVVYDLAPGHERPERVTWGLFARVIQPHPSRWDRAPLRLWPGEVRWNLFRRQSWTGPIPPFRPIPPAPKPVPTGPGHLFSAYPGWPVPPGFQGRLHSGRKYSAARYGINMITELGLFKLPTLEPIRFQSLTIDEAMDSHSRLLRVQIKDRASYLLLQPDEDLNPAEVRAVLNGYSFDFVVIEGSGGFAFADTTFTINAQSRIVYLGAPYAPARDFREANTRTAHQLADQEVENTGFEIEFDSVDWLVPAGVFSYQNSTPLDVLKRLAATVGAYVSDDPTDLKVTIAPKYLIEPWLWGSQQPVTTLTASQVKEYSLQNTRFDDCNRIVISGGNTGKVRVVAVRSGTAGDHSKALSPDSLICDVDAGTEKARQFFSAAGRHVDVVLTGIPLAPAPDDPKLLHLGDLVRVEWGEESWIGMITAVKIEAQIGRLLQTISVDRFLET